MSYFNYDLNNLKMKAADLVGRRSSCEECPAEVNEPCIHKTTGRPMKGVHSSRRMSGLTLVANAEHELYESIILGEESLQRYVNDGEEIGENEGLVPYDVAGNFHEDDIYLSGILRDALAYYEQVQRGEEHPGVVAWYLSCAIRIAMRIERWWESNAQQLRSIRYGKGGAAQ